MKRDREKQRPKAKQTKRDKKETDSRPRLPQLLRHLEKGATRETLQLPQDFSMPVPQLICMAVKLRNFSGPQWGCHCAASRFWPRPWYNLRLPRGRQPPLPAPRQTAGRITIWAPTEEGFKLEPSFSPRLLGDSDM